MDWDDARFVVDPNDRSFLNELTLLNDLTFTGDGTVDANGMMEISASEEIRIMSDENIELAPGPASRAIVHGELEVDDILLRTGSYNTWITNLLPRISLQAMYVASWDNPYVPVPDCLLTSTPLVVIHAGREEDTPRSPYSSGSGRDRTQSRTAAVAEYMPVCAAAGVSEPCWQIREKDVHPRAPANEVDLDFERVVTTYCDNTASLPSGTTL